jgi:hypothetical protein
MVLDDEVGAIGNQLGVNAKDMGDGAFGLFRRVEPLAQRPGCHDDQLVQRAGVFRPGKT